MVRCVRSWPRSIRRLDSPRHGTPAPISVDAGTVYAGGDFTVIGAQFRNRIAALDPGTGLATGWNPWANATVRAITVTPAAVYVGGDFTTLGGQFRDHIAAIDGNGLPTIWNPGADGSVRTLLVKGGAVYVGGSFATLGGLERSRLGAVTTAGGGTTTWNPQPNGDVLGLAQGPTDLVAVGSFLRLADAPATFVAGFDASAATDVPPGGESFSAGLEWVAPNPTAGPVTIAFALRQPSWVRIRIHDLQGREVARPMDELRPAGRAQAIWNPAGGRPNPAGIYFLRYEAEGMAASKQVIVLR